MEAGRAGHRAKGGSGIEKRLEAVMPEEDAPPNGDAPTDEDDSSGEDWVGLRRRVSEMQAKLSRAIEFCPAAVVEPAR